MPPSITMKSSVKKTMIQVSPCSSALANTMSMFVMGGRRSSCAFEEMARDSCDEVWLNRKNGMIPVMKNICRFPIGAIRPHHDVDRRQPRRREDPARSAPTGSRVPPKRTRVSRKISDRTTLSCTCSAVALTRLLRLESCLPLPIINRCPACAGLILEPDRQAIRKSERMIRAGKIALISIFIKSNQTWLGSEMKNKCGICSPIIKAFPCPKSRFFRDGPAATPPAARDHGSAIAQAPVQYLSKKST